MSQMPRERPPGIVFRIIHRTVRWLDENWSSHESRVRNTRGTSDCSSQGARTKPAEANSQHLNSSTAQQRNRHACKDGQSYSVIPIRNSTAVDSCFHKGSSSSTIILLSDVAVLWGVNLHYFLSAPPRSRWSQLTSPWLQSVAKSHEGVAARSLSSI